MPPVKESHAVHGVQDDLHTLFTARFPTIMDRRILEDQSHSMMPHVRTHIDSKQGEYHSHDDGNKDEIESGDLQQAAVLVRVSVNILILNGRLQPSRTLALHSRGLFFELEVELPHWFLSVPNNLSAPEK